jgi:hypothetical protein
MSSRAVTSKVSALLSKYTSPKASSTASSIALSPSQRPASAVTSTQEDEFDVDFDSEGEPIRRLRPRTAEPTNNNSSAASKRSSTTSSIVARSLPESQLHDAIAKFRSASPRNQRQRRRDDLSEEVTDDLSVEIDYDNDTTKLNKPPLHPPRKPAKKDDWESEFEEELGTGVEDDEKVQPNIKKSNATSSRQPQRIKEEPQSVGEELTIDVSSDIGSPQARTIKTPMPHTIVNQRPTTATSEDEIIEFDDESQQQQQKPPAKPNKPHNKPTIQRNASPSDDQMTEIEFDEEPTPAVSPAAAAAVAATKLTSQQQIKAQLQSKSKSTTSAAARQPEILDQEIEFDEEIVPPKRQQQQQQQQQQRGVLQPISTNKQQSKSVIVEDADDEIDDEVDGPVKPKIKSQSIALAAPNATKTVASNDDYSEVFISAGATSLRQNNNNNKFNVKNTNKNTTARAESPTLSDSRSNSPHCCHCHHARGENRRTKQRRSSNHYSVVDIGIQTEPYLSIEAPPGLFPSYRMPSQSIMAQQQQQHWLSMGIQPLSNNNATTLLPPYFPFASPELHSELHKEALQPLDEAQLQQQQQQSDSVTVPSTESTNQSGAASALPSLASAFAPSIDAFPLPPHMRQQQQQQSQSSQSNQQSANAINSTLSGPSLSDEKRSKIDRLYPFSSGLSHNDATHAMRQQLSNILSSLDAAKKQLDQNTHDYNQWRAEQLNKRNPQSYQTIPTMSYATALASMRW